MYQGSLKNQLKNLHASKAVDLSWSLLQVRLFSRLPTIFGYCTWQQTWHTLSMPTDWCQSRAFTITAAAWMRIIFETFSKNTNFFSLEIKTSNETSSFFLNGIKEFLFIFTKFLNKINLIKPLLTHLPLCRSQCSPGSVHLKSMQPRHLEVIGSQVGWGALHSWLLEQPRNMYFQFNEQGKIAFLFSIF